MFPSSDSRFPARDLNAASQTGQREVKNVAPRPCFTVMKMMTRGLKNRTDAFSVQPVFSSSVCPFSVFLYSKKKKSQIWRFLWNLSSSLMFLCKLVQTLSLLGETCTSSPKLWVHGVCVFFVFFFSNFCALVSGYGFSVTVILLLLFFQMIK